MGEPWAADLIPVSKTQSTHLDRVLRLEDGHDVTYTDGVGGFGEGRYERGQVLRGREWKVEAPSDLVVVSAPPDNRDRARFLVEKLSELGVAHLRFLQTRYGQGRPPREDRLRSWAASGLEQSRGAWLMRTSGEPITFADIVVPFSVCDQGGIRAIPPARTVVIGPEGGWAEGEVPEDAMRVDLGATVLRVETAAMVAAARMI
ncbi:MAG: 16S rRNA (uracil(1498)-N(3))-methyltransferase [Acidimicrobiia bacterium]